MNNEQKERPDAGEEPVSVPDCLPRLVKVSYAQLHAEKARQRREQDAIDQPTGRKDETDTPRGVEAE